MDAMEQKVYDFVLSKTKKDDQTKMKQLLDELLTAKQNHQLTKMSLLTKAPQALRYLEPNSVEEVKAMLNQLLKK